MTASADERLASIASSLESLADELSGAAMEILHEGLHDGSEEAALAAAKREKIVNRARAAVEKARHLVLQAGEGSA